MMGGAVACTVVDWSIASDGAHCDRGPPWHEFNLWFDPHAAQRVLRSVPHVTGNWTSLDVLPSDVASQPMWSEALQAAVRAKQSSSATAAYIATYTFGSPDAAYPLFDELSALFFLTCGRGSRQQQVGQRHVSSPLGWAHAAPELQEARSSTVAAGCPLVSGARAVLVDASVDASSAGMLLAWPAVNESTSRSSSSSATDGYWGPRLGEQPAVLYLGRVDLELFEQLLLSLL